MRNTEEIKGIEIIKCEPSVYDKSVSRYKLYSKDGRSGLFTKERLKEYLKNRNIDIKSLINCLTIPYDFLKAYDISFEDAISVLHCAYSDFQRSYPSATIVTEGLRWRDNENFKIIPCMTEEEAKMYIAFGIVSEDILNLTLKTDKGIWLEYEIYKDGVPQPTAYLLFENDNVDYGLEILDGLMKFVPEQITEVKDLRTIKNISKRIQIKNDMLDIFFVYNFKKKHQKELI